MRKVFLVTYKRLFIIIGALLLIMSGILYIGANGSIHPTLLQVARMTFGDNIEQLKAENTKYIPLKEGVTTENQCLRNVVTTNPPKIYDIDTVLKKGHELALKVKYQNKDYRRPLYHPAWKKNDQRGWSYIPRKICENLHSLFVIPNEADKSKDLLGSLAFFEKHDAIQSNEIGFLVYGFSIQKAVRHNNQILLIGTPSRTGAQIATVNGNELAHNSNYIIQLITPDNREFDYHYLQTK